MPLSVRCTTNLLIIIIFMRVEEGSTSIKVMLISNEMANTFFNYGHLASEFF